MKTIIFISCFGVLSYLLSFVLSPILKKIAIAIELVDIPNFRKVHTEPIPLIGGIMIGTIFLLLIVLANAFIQIDKQYYIIIACSYILLIVGIIDDKKDIRAIYKLAIQLLLSFIIAFNGTRISSLYGIFNVYELPIYWQYIITIFVITATINAFNFMDGVDGLVGSLSLFSFFLILAIGIFNKNYPIILIASIIIGSLIVFLKFNLSKSKIFMGDAGSLFLSFMLITLGIQFLNNNLNQNTNQSYILAVVITIFSIPIFDSIRVYLTRLKAGKSPLVADKSHIHHLLLNTGLSHIRISTIITLLTFLIFVTNLGIININNPNFIILGGTIIFLIFIKILLIINKLTYWKNKIHELENL